MQRGGARELVSASTDGKVCVWDIRLSNPVLEFSASNSGISVMDLHEHAPILATSNKNVQMWSTLRLPVATVRTSNASYMSGNRGATLSHLSFHPHRMMMATNNQRDANVMIFNCSYNGE